MALLGHWLKFGYIIPKGSIGPFIFRCLSLHDVNVQYIPSYNYCRHEIHKSLQIRVQILSHLNITNWTTVVQSPAWFTRYLGSINFEWPLLLYTYVYQHKTDDSRVIEFASWRFQIRSTLFGANATYFFVMKKKPLDMNLHDIQSHDKLSCFETGAITSIGVIANH